jgi:hypothetical protein
MEMSDFLDLLVICNYLVIAIEEKTKGTKKKFRFQEVGTENKF